MNAYLFDVDGVLTNSESTENISPEIITALINLLQQNTPMGFISGRAMIWLRAKLVKAIEKYVENHPAFDKKILDLLYVGGEFGVVTATHTNGERIESIEKSLVIPQKIKIALVMYADQFSDYVLNETEKQTIFSLRYITNDQQALQNVISSFQSFIINYPELELQSDRFAINIRHKNVNKKYATDKFLQWLKEKAVITEKYIVFGDSPSDLEMGEELQRQNLPFEFIYVGEQSELNQSKPSFPITVTKGHYDLGTIEYLKKRDDSI